MGKVIDQETGQPLAGAVIFVEFGTVRANVAGGTWSYYDAMEVLTNEQGEFYLVPPRMWRMPIGLEVWSSCQAIIFKPGYGIYPAHPESSKPDRKWDGNLPADEYVIIKLPKLKTIEERMRNLLDLWVGSSGTPIEKYNNLFKLERIERAQIGLKP